MNETELKELLHSSLSSEEHNLFKSVLSTVITYFLLVLIVLVIEHRTRLYNAIKYVRIALNFFTWERIKILKSLIKELVYMKISNYFNSTTKHPTLKGIYIVNVLIGFEKF